MPDSNDQKRPNGGNDGGEREFDRVIRRFARAFRVLLSQDPAALPEFIAFRNAVLDAVESRLVVDDIARALTKLHEAKGTTEVAHLLVMEVEAFSAAVERAQAQPVTTEPPERPWWKRLLGIGKTATDSVSDILEGYLGPHARAILKLLSEAADILGGD